MTLIDKAEALAPCPFCGGEAEWKSGGPGCAWISCKSCPAETSDGSIPRIMEAWNRRAALPARGVGVKPLVWEAREDLKGLYEARGADGLYRNVWDQQDGTWVYEGDPTANPQQQARLPTLDAAKAAAQADYEARILAALAPTDAAQAREATFRDGWGFAYRQWQATGSVPDPDYKPSTETRT